MTYSVESLFREHKQLIFATLGIFLVFLIPVPVPLVTNEENPDDGEGLLLHKNNPIVFTIDSPSSSVTKVLLRAGDTLRAPVTTKLEIDVSNNETLKTTLGDILHEGKNIVIPLRTDTTKALSVKISSPSLDEKRALILRTQQDNNTVPTYVVYEPQPIILALMAQLYDQKATADDIQYVWSEGKAITNGTSPYKRAEKGSKESSKYAIYFPLSYIISAAIQKIGFEEFEPWLNIVRPLVYTSQLITALAVLLFLYSKKKLALGVLGFFLIIFHRFVLYPARVTHIDFPAIAFLLVGLIFLSKKPKLAYILIGISLAIKQMAIFIIPLIIIWAWQRYKTKRQVIVATVLLALIPFLSLLPFVIDSPSGTLNSIVYSANRASTGDFTSPDISSLLSLEGFTARIPMLGLMGLIFIAFWRKEIAIFGACLAIFTVFVGFNPALFFQYLAWLIPLIALAIAESKTKDPAPLHKH